MIRNYWLRVVHIQLQNYTKAIEHFQEILETEGNSCEYPSSNATLAVVYWNLACAFYQQKQLTECLKNFRECESILTSEVNLILLMCHPYNINFYL